MARMTAIELIAKLGQVPNQAAEVRLASGTNLNGTAALDDLVTINSHGLAVGDMVRLVAAAGGVGLTVGDSYFVISDGLTANVFKLSATAGGAAVDITTAYTMVAFARQSVGSVTPTAAGQTFAPDAPGAEFGANGPAKSSGTAVLGS